MYLVHLLQKLSIICGIAQEKQSISKHIIGEILPWRFGNLPRFAFLSIVSVTVQQHSSPDIFISFLEHPFRSEQLHSLCRRFSGISVQLEIPSWPCLVTRQIEQNNSSCSPCLLASCFFQKCFMQLPDGESGTHCSLLTAIIIIIIVIIMTLSQWCISTVLDFCFP